MRKNGILGAMAACAAACAAAWGQPPVLEAVRAHSSPGPAWLSWPVAVKHAEHYEPGTGAVFVAGTVNEAGRARYGVVRYSVNPGNPDDAFAIWPFSDDDLDRPLRAMDLWSNPSASSLLAHVYVAGEIPGPTGKRTLVAAFDQDLGRPLWTRIFQRPTDDVGDDIPVAVVAIPPGLGVAAGVGVLVACYNEDRSKVRIGLHAYNLSDSGDRMPVLLHQLTDFTLPIGMAMVGTDLFVTCQARDPLSNMGSYYTVGFKSGWDPNPFATDWDPANPDNLTHMVITVPGRNLQPVSIARVHSSPETFIVTGTSFDPEAPPEVFTVSYNHGRDRTHAPTVEQQVLRWTDSWTPSTGGSVAQHVSASGWQEDVPPPTTTGTGPDWGRVWVTGTVWGGEVEKNNVLVIQYDNDYLPPACRRHWFANWDRGDNHDYGIMSQVLFREPPHFLRHRVMVGANTINAAGEWDFTGLKFDVEVTCAAQPRLPAWEPQFIPYYIAGEDNFLTGFAAAWVQTPVEEHAFRRFWFTGPSGVGNYTWRTVQYKDLHD
jgi:hypothetical protein